jgi:hypothetical protein
MAGENKPTGFEGFSTEELEAMQAADKAKAQEKPPEQKSTLSKVADTVKNTAVDTGKSALSGLVHGSLGFLGGLPGMIQGGQGGAGAFGVTGPGEQAAVGTPTLPTASDISRKIGKTTGYNEYSPQTGLGSIAKNTTGGIIPALAGPEGLAVNFARYALAPAITGELGQAVGGPVGRFIAALLGPTVAGRAVTPRNIAPAGTRPGTTEPNLKADQQTLQAHGINPSASRISESGPVARRLEETPKKIESELGGFNKAALGQAGITGPGTERFSTGAGGNIPAGRAAVNASTAPGNVQTNKNMKVIEDAVGNRQSGTLTPDDIAKSISRVEGPAALQSGKHGFPFLDAARRTGIGEKPPPAGKLSESVWPALGASTAAVVGAEMGHGGEMSWLLPLLAGGGVTGHLAQEFASGIPSAAMRAPWVQKWLSNTRVPKGPYGPANPKNLNTADMLMLAKALQNYQATPKTENK